MAERSYHIGEVRGSIPFRAYHHHWAVIPPSMTRPAPSHEPGVVRGEKDDALGDVGHIPHAADGDTRQRLLAGRFEVVGARLRARIART